MGAWSKLKDWFAEKDPQAKQAKGKEIAEGIDAALPEVIGAHGAIEEDRKRKKRLLEDQLKD